MRLGGTLVYFPANRATTGASASIRLKEAFDQPDRPVILYRVYYERDVAPIRAQLEAAEFDANWEAGRRLTLEQTIDSALLRAADLCEP